MLSLMSRAVSLPAALRVLLGPLSRGGRGCSVLSSYNTLGPGSNTGFEISWLNGSPESRRVGRSVDKLQGAVKDSERRCISTTLTAKIHVALIGLDSDWRGARIQISWHPLVQRPTEATLTSLHYFSHYGGRQTSACASSTHPRSATGNAV